MRFTTIVVAAAAFLTTGCASIPVHHRAHGAYRSLSSVSTSIDFCTTPFEEVCSNIHPVTVSGDPTEAFLKSQGMADVQSAFLAYRNTARASGADDLSDKRDQFYIAFEKEALRRTGGAAQIESFIDGIRSDLIGFIQAEPGLDADTRQQMAERVGAVRFETIADYLAKGPDTNPLVTYATTEVDQSCSGLAENAFLTDKGIVLCPMELLRTLDYTATPNHFDFLVQTLAHEMSHSIDSEIFPNAYQAFSACVSKQYGFGNTYFYLRELVADYWGDKVLGKRVAQASASARLPLLGANMACYCGDEQSSDHPSGRFRIEKLLRETSSVGSALSCKELAPVCGLAPVR